MVGNGIVRPGAGGRVTLGGRSVSCKVGASVGTTFWD